MVWPRSQVANVGGCVFHWLRRDRVLLRDIRRFGTATSALLSGTKLGQGRPTGVGLVVRVLGFDVVEPSAAAGAQSAAVLVAEGGQRDLEDQGIPQRRFEVEEVLDHLRLLVVAAGAAGPGRPL